MSRGSRILAACCAATLLLLCGCWDSRDVDNRLIVGALGLEHADGDTVRIWVRFPLPKATLEQSKKDFFVISQEGHTVPDALYKVGYKLPKAVDASSTRALLIDEKLAKVGLAPYLEFAMRERSVPLDTVVAVVRGNMEHIFSSPNPTGELSGIYTKLFFEPYAGGMPRKNKTRLWEIYSKFHNPFHANLIPLLKEGEQNSFEFAGNVIFRGDKIIGELNKDESLLYQLFTHRFHDAEVELMDRADVRIVHNISHIDTSMKAGIPTIRIHCELSLTLIDSSHWGDASKTDVVSELETELKGLAKSMFEKTQRAGADVFGFGNRYRGQLTSSQYADWSELYKRARIDYTFGIELRNTGLQFLEPPTQR
ncbi:germination protein GerC [Paenibacillus sp. 598K]|uniref:Ger(x)C family spore germination protein n=1 Tax=Paenibacillus sp. 598K TaxID=1117987 RepID=UPI000FF981BD|nr:Ger(x)C family spore germination protein [Paenibacillus sp. 598K]GBF73949.1 germination protein GerC [Paenibacillus sp. 598K]